MSPRSRVQPGDAEGDEVADDPGRVVRSSGREHRMTIRPPMTSSRSRAMSAAQCSTSMWQAAVHLRARPRARRAGPTRSRCSGAAGGRGADLAAWRGQIEPSAHAATSISATDWAPPARSTSHPEHRARRSGRIRAAQPSSRPGWSVAAGRRPQDTDRGPRRNACSRRTAASPARAATSATPGADRNPAMSRRVFTNCTPASGSTSTGLADQHGHLRSLPALQAVHLGAGQAADRAWAPACSTPAQTSWSLVRRPVVVATHRSRSTCLPPLARAAWPAT